MIDVGVSYINAEYVSSFIQSFMLTTSHFQGKKWHLRIETVLVQVTAAQTTSDNINIIPLLFPHFSSFFSYKFWVLASLVLLDVIILP